MAHRDKDRADHSTHGTHRPSNASVRFNYNTKDPEGSGNLLFVNQGPKFDDGYSSATAEGYNEEHGWESQHTLPYVTGYLFGSIVEEAVASMNIIRECNSSLPLAMAEADMDRLIASKYQIEEEIITDELAHIKPSIINSNYYKLEKLISDSSYVHDFLDSLCFDLVSCNNFRQLIHRNRTLTAKADQYRKVMEQNTDNKSLLREIRRTMRTARQNNMRALYDCDNEIDRLTNLIRDKDLQFCIENRYVANLQNSRLEAEEVRFVNKEKVHTESITHHINEWEKDTRVHQEINNFNAIIIAETVQKTENVMWKYEKDTEKMNMSIHNLRHKHEEMVDKRKHLELTFQHHQELMDKWIKFKEDRIKKNEYGDMMMQSAIKVQAWWRGILVRKELGPYRPQRARKGRKKASTSTK